MHDTTRQRGRFGRALLATALLLTSLSLLAASPAHAEEELCLSDSPDIYDFSVANFYNDALPNTMTQRNWSRIVVVPGAPLPILPGAFCPSTVKSILITGPGGFSKSIINQPFTKSNLNGWLKDPGTGAIAYTRIQTVGFAANGEYKVVVTYNNGVKKSKTRTLNFDANDQRILDKYKANKASIAPKPTLGSKLPASTDPSAVKITWTKLNTANNVFDFLPPTVFYSTRVATGTGNNPANGIWSSSCILGDLLCGLNPPEFTIGATLVKGEWYSYGLELSDSSALGTTDLVIGMKGSYFKIATS